MRKRLNLLVCGVVACPHAETQGGSCGPAPSRLVVVKSGRVIPEGAEFRWARLPVGRWMGRSEV